MNTQTFRSTRRADWLRVYARGIEENPAVSRLDEIRIGTTWESVTPVNKIEFILNTDRS
ncbi:MAG: hypothetical protein JJU05_08850 [Verrucomicrobia bacterium]|nr:hypothetical protein [Verrucomicrobiota bacterium]MCH8527002.1 hypothetical protein [Kiritimatiellia bacterium]